MEEIVQKLNERFPILTRLVVNATTSSCSEVLPPYLGMILAVLETPSETPVCFVHPRWGDIVRLVVILYAWQQLTRKLPDLAQCYGEANFKKNDLVRIHPTKHIYRYGGFDKKSPASIWLESLTTWSKRRLVPAEGFITRLEKTIALRPKGQLNSPIFSPKPEPIDILLGTKFYGNFGLVKNEIVLLDTQNTFKQFLEINTLQLAGLTSKIPPLIDLCPFGQLTWPTSSNPKWISRWDERNPTGEPIVAVTHSAELLAKYCSNEPAHSKVIVINGLSHLKNLQSFDDIFQTQKLVLFANHDEKDEIASLGQRGCHFWWLNHSEINACIGKPISYTNGIIGTTMKWAYNSARMRIKAVPCESQELEDIVLRLASFEKAVIADTASPLAKIVKQAWNIFLDASNIIGPINDTENKRLCEQISMFRRKLQNNSAWLTPDQSKVLNNISDRFKAVITTGAKSGINKEEALIRIIKDRTNTGLKYILVVRSPNHVVRLETWLKQCGLSNGVKVFSSSILTTDGDLDEIICVSWLGNDSIKRIANSLVAPCITVITYPFEQRWMDQFQNRLKDRPDVFSVSSSEKLKFVMRDKNIAVKWIEDEAENKPLLPTPVISTDIWDFERSLRAIRKGNVATPMYLAEPIQSRYVSFLGQSYAYLTETHKVAIVTDLISGQSNQNKVIPERIITNIKEGDYVVFPKSGNRELIQEKADQLIGIEAPNLRMLAHLWKDALIESKISPEKFLYLVNKLGIQKQIGTIRNWYGDNSQIGPREKDDLSLIFQITGNKQLQAKIGDVRNAIEKLWSYHLRAGVQLHDIILQNLPQAISHVEENGTLLNLGELGEVWVVQVEFISPDTELHERGEINHLRWE